MSDITLGDIRRAAERIKGMAWRTPLEHSRWLSDRTGRDVLLKLECFQPTGSFKLRGAMSKLSALSPVERERGILTVSAGNHGLAVAHCAEQLELDATVVVSKLAARSKVEAMRRYPINLIEVGTSYEDAERAAHEMERESGRIFVSPYNDRDVIAGQGTIGVEIVQEDENVDAIVVPVGGGGLIAGIAIAARSLNPAIKVYGAEPMASPTMSEALAAGRLVNIEEGRTIADGLAGNIEVDSITFPIIRDLAERMIKVSEAAIRESIRQIALEDRLICEGSAAVAVAALTDPGLEGRRVAAVITGKNIDLDLFLEVVGTPRSP